MTESTFKERVARLGPGRVKSIDRVSGSPAVVHLVCPDRSKVRVPTASLELVKRGLTLLRAKRAVEAALSNGRVAIKLPAVENKATFAKSMAAAGLVVRFVRDENVDVRGLREELDLTREQFALRFNLPVETVEKWETGERQPDAGSLAYLRVIARDPEAAMVAQEVE